MKRATWSALAIALAALVGIWGISQAQSGGGYTLERSVIAGGGDTSTGGGYTLSGTIGQPLTSESSGGGYTLQSGFWPGIAAPCVAPDVTASLSSPTNIQLSWSGGNTYNVYRAENDPYFASGALISSNQSSPYIFAESSLGNASISAYYLLGPDAACGDRLGEFEFVITPGA